jgi:hypothetical protein
MDEERDEKMGVDEYLSSVHLVNLYFLDSYY